MNVGASTQEELGLYFSWGNSPGHPKDSGYNFSQEVYNETPGADIETDLTLAEDMARQSIGSPWRLPTDTEFEELYDNCESVWTTMNGVNGQLFTSRANGKKLFLPAAGRYDGTVLGYDGSAGYYWSSSYNSALEAGYLYFDSSTSPESVEGARRVGFTVRAVQSS